MSSSDLLNTDLLRAIKALAESQNQQNQKKKEKAKATTKYVRNDADDQELSVHYKLPHVCVGTIILPKNGHTVEYRKNKLWYDTSEGYICVKDKSGLVRKFPESQAHLARKYWEDITTPGKVFRTYPGIAILEHKLQELPTKHHPIWFSRGNTRIRAVAQDSKNRYYTIVLPESNNSKTIVTMEVDLVMSNYGLVYQYSATVTTTDNTKLQETFDAIPKQKCKGKVLAQQQVDIPATTLGRNHFIDLMNKALRTIGSDYTCQLYR